MKIATLCTRRLVTLDGEADLVRAAGLMREHHVGALVVATRAAEGVGVLGVVTDGDLVVDALAREVDLSGTRMATLASASLAAIGEEADGRLVGLLSLDDLLSGPGDDRAGLTGVIQAGIERETRETAPPPPLPTNLLRTPAVGTAGWGLPR